MIEAEVVAAEYPRATDGNIAVMNLDSTRQQSWSRFWQAPWQPGIAERIVAQEQLTAQFLGDLHALDRVHALVDHLALIDADPQRTALVSAQVASMAHRFSEASEYLTRVNISGSLSEEAGRLSLSINQACGIRLDEVLDARLKIAAENPCLEHLVPLGALLADLGEFEEADRVYVRALSEYQDVSPFALAWVCFQLGSLWGELVPEPDGTLAAQWYKKAIEYLPCYVKARVHLSEIYMKDGYASGAEELLLPILSTTDPEIPWRLADVMVALGRYSDAEAYMKIARSGYEALLAKYELAFADHGAEFYAGSGDDAARALELARLNVANRPTLRAFEQAYEIAVAAGELKIAVQLCADGARLWGSTCAFNLSSLVTCGTKPSEQIHGVVGNSAGPPLDRTISLCE